MQRKEYEFYNKIKNWDFSNINYESIHLTNWDYIEKIKEYSNEETKILDLGTGGGEQVIYHFPKVKEILGTDFSEEMIITANKNLKNSNKNYIHFKVMDNLNMKVEDDYFDIVTARNTIIDAKGIYKALKPGGMLILRGVDKLDCWQLKRLFKRGQAYLDEKPISQIDYENILDAGFKKVELIPIYTKGYYKTKEDLLALLLKTPILEDFSETKENTKLGNKKFGDDEKDFELLDKYISENSFDKGILLRRRYYGIIAKK